jgi:uncharacterized membrane protein (DUF4010 family)
VIAELSSFGPSIWQLAGPFMISAGLGALIGLVRQWAWQQDHPQESEYAGVRTFTIWALLGCATALISERFGVAVFSVALAGLCLYLIAARVMSRPEQAEGYTTFAVMMETFFLGALVYSGERGIAVMLAAGTMVLLGSKRPISRWTRKFTSSDMFNVLQFVAITGVVLPLVPNKGYGPFAAFNPYDTWLMVVIMAGVGFAGYVLVRLFGPQAGFALAGLVGGLASSTATTLSFSRRSRETPDLSPLCTLAVILACDVMLVRVAVMVGTISPELLGKAAAPLAILIAPGTLLAAWGWWHTRKHPGASPPSELQNPLGLFTAIRFAALYALIKFLVKAAVELQWTTAILPLAALSGLTDMDAIALTLARSVTEHTVPVPVAVQGLIIAAISNSVLKGVLAASLGSPALRWKVLAVMALTTAAGGAALFLL